MAFTVDFDAKSKMIARQMRGHLPTREINSGINRVIKSEMRAVRTQINKEANKTAGLKTRFLKQISGVKVRKQQGVYWIAARNFILHRLGNIKPTGYRQRVVATGRTLSKQRKATEKAFRINNAAVIRDKGKIRAFFAATRKPIKRAFDNQVARMKTDFEKALRKEMEFRLMKWRKQIGVR